MSNELISTIVRECLVPAVPYDPEQMPFFDKLLDEAKQFHKSLVVCYHVLRFYTIFRNNFVGI